MVGLENDNHSHLELVGSSCKASVLPGKTPLTYIGFEPQERQSAVVAVIIHVCHSEKGREKSTSRESHLFKINWKDGKTHLDVKEVWVPMKERLGQFVGEHLQVHAGDEFYGTDRAKAEKDSSYNFVPDCNLLCRYLNGTANIPALKAAVEKVKVEESVNEKAEREKAELNRLLREHINRLSAVKTVARNEIGFLWNGKKGWKQVCNLLKDIP